MLHTMKQPKRIAAVFFQTAAGREPVREFLLGVKPKSDRIKINADIRTAEYGWPIGMPTCRALSGGLSEIRTNLNNRIARVLFYVDKRSKMVLLSGFVKKTQETPQSEIDLAHERRKAHERALNGEGS